MPRILINIILLLVLKVSALSADHLGEYLNDQVPSDYRYPLWLRIVGDYVWRVVISGLIFFGVSGVPDKKIVSIRGMGGLVVALLFFSTTVIYQDIYHQLLQWGIQGLAILLGGVLVICIAANIVLSLFKKK